MRVCRVNTDNGPRFGVIQGQEVHLALANGPLLADPDDYVASGEVMPLAEVKFLAPTVPSKIMAIGRNYAAHAAEMGFELPEQPSVFMKPPTSMIPHGGTVVLPPTDVSDEVEHEAELAVVIGKKTFRAGLDAAFDAVYGYAVSNDVSARDLQRKDKHVTRAKGFDTFCPVGPWIETDVDESPRAIRCSVNGELRQDGNTKDLIFSVSQLISSVSQWTTLLPGDVLLTGSPAGTGLMTPSDIVEIEIEGVGKLVHSVAACAP